MRLLSGKNAIITGTRRGIGRATMERFTQYGANVWACARKKEEAFEREIAELAEKNGVSIWPVYFDLTNESEMKQAVQTIRAQKIPVDILVNNAGIADDSTRFQMTSLEKMHHVMEVNFFAGAMLTQYICRLMSRQGAGSIVNVASVAGIDGEPAQFEYVASKAAVIGGTRNLARELASDHIRVNAVAPGIVATDMGAKIEENLKNEILSKVIMKRPGDPSEIADVIAFLASDLARYMTGQVIRVDGGM